MPTYRVRLTAQATDIVDAWVTCEAASRDDAEVKAMAEVWNGHINWHFYQCGDLHDYEVDTIEEDNDA